MPILHLSQLIGAAAGLTAAPSSSSSGTWYPWGLRSRNSKSDLRHFGYTSLGAGVGRGQQRSGAGPSSSSSGLVRLAPRMGSE